MKVQSSELLNRRALPLLDSALALTCITPIDAVKQLRSGYAKRPCQLGDRPHARLTLAALDLGHVGHVEVGDVR